MSRVVASAPGKLVLCGEYVVLDGAPAMGLAIDRRAVVTLQGSATSAGHAAAHRLTCPGFDNEAREFRLTGDNVFAWAPASGTLPNHSLLELAWQASDFRPAGALDLLLDSRAFVDRDSGLKLGVGSSAALLVALLGAFGEVDALRPELQSAIEIHRLFQGGRGSGIDVATAWYGGLIHYRTGTSPVCESMEWPPGLAYAVLWSGIASETKTRLHLYHGKPLGTRIKTVLADASAALVAAWPAAGVGELMGLFTDYVAHLAEFDEALGLGILEGGHAGLIKLATEHGVVYKPSGAGGGDVGVALAADPARLHAFADSASRAGFRRLRVGIDETGLQTATYDS